MNLKLLSKDQLVQNLKNLVSDERRITTEILHYLKEVEAQRIFDELGYKSMYYFIKDHLGYSEGQAYRRLNALKVLKEIPEVSKKIESGELLVSVIADAQNVFKDANLTLDEKKAVLEKLENKSTREAEKELFKIKPPVKAKETIKRIGFEEFEVKIIITEELKAKLDELNAFYSHKNPNQKYQDLLKLLIEEKYKEFITKLNNAKKAELMTRLSNTKEAGLMTQLSNTNEKGLITRFHKTKNVTNNLNKAASSLNKASDQVESANQAQAKERILRRTYSSAPKFNSFENNRTIRNTEKKVNKTITPKTRLEIRAKYNNQCSYVSLDGKRCDSKHFLEIDHVKPIGKSGTNHPDNLRLYCRTHNQLAAIRQYGKNKMQKYLTSRS